MSSRIQVSVFLVVKFVWSVPRSSRERGIGGRSFFEVCVRDLSFEPIKFIRRTDACVGFHFSITRKFFKARPRAANALAKASEHRATGIRTFLLANAHDKRTSQGLWGWAQRSTRAGLKRGPKAAMLRRALALRYSYRTIINLAGPDG